MSSTPPLHEFPNPPTSPVIQPIELLSPAVATATQPKVMIAVCTRDWQVEAHTSESIRQMGRLSKCQIDVRYMMNDGVARARNNLAAMFLESDCTHLLFLDNDIIMEPRHLDRLLQADKPLVCAIYPKKQPVLDWVVNYLPETAPDANGFMKVKHAGTGAWLLRKPELLAHLEKHPEIKYSGDPHPGAVRYDLFPMHAREGEYLSEDWYFCDRWRGDGFEIWIDTKSQLRHIGKIVYPLQFTMSDEDVVDLLHHRYGIWPDLIRTFIGTGAKPPGLMGGHRERAVRLWPKDYPVSDLHQGEVMAGLYDVPALIGAKMPPVIIDIGADCGMFARWAQKRWTGCTIYSFEADETKLGLLRQSVAGLMDAGSKAVFMPMGEFVPANRPDALAAANIVKIDLPSGERGIMDALHSMGVIPKLDAILIRYSSEIQAFFIKTMLDTTHFMHCYQRINGTSGVMKFIRRDLNPEVLPLRGNE